jgi:hypothetical protein
MTAKDLKRGSIIEEFAFFHENEQCVRRPVQRIITRASEHFVWYKNSGLCRLGKGTIEKYPTLYKIISI